LFLANDKDIKIINFKSSAKEADLIEVVPQPGQFSTFSLPPGNKLHGFFENSESHKDNFLLMVIEGTNNFIDFAKLTFVGGETGNVTNIELHEYREPV
jgi:hypothetical protein